MFEMPALPDPKNVVRGDLNGRGKGITGVYSGRHELISLHEEALVALQEQYDNRYPGMKMALASSANTPFAEKIGRASLKLLEVVPGTSVWDLLMRDWDSKDVNQIGRQPPKLSPNKAKSHFPNLHKMTGIPFSRMLFFDDCNWGDHVGAVERGCKEADGQGVTGYRTPYGLGVSEWREGMRKYAELHRPN
jgi:magnesium-dependent phosphatase 1